VVVGIIGILAAVGIVSYVGYVAGAQKTDAQNNMQAMYMVQEEYKTSNTGNSCTPNSSNHNTINTNLFGGKEQIDISDPKFVFCIAGGSNSDGGFKIYSQRPDGSDQMTLNANNAKSGW
jgi:type II secretory pathway pseudopilin PulG